MSEVMFPQRKRCKGCGKGLGLRITDPVLDGLYCSASCAGVPEPANRAIDAPRECRTQRDGRWAFKRKYRAESEIPDVIRQDPSTNWYRCSSCRHLHIGHTRVGEREQFRMFADALTDIPDLLVKLRGQATHKQVASVAGVRPIRIKELEEGRWHPESIPTLAKLCDVYGVRLGVAMPRSR